MEPISVLSILRIEDQYVLQIEGAGTGRGASRVVATWTLDETTRRALRDEVTATAQLLNDCLQPEGLTAAERPDDLPDPWLSLGRRLYAQLLPATAKAFLQQLPAGTPMILATNDTGLPWELLHNGDRYLALAHPVGRQLLLDAPPRYPERHTSSRCVALLVGNPTGDLGEADIEVQRLIQHVEMLPDAKRPRALLRQRATKDAVLRELSSGEYTLIHYAGHAHADPAGEGGAALVLAGGERLTADEIAQHMSGEPLVFLNACASAQEADQPNGSATGLAHLQGTQGLAAGFIRGGAWGVVGTLWPVHDAGSRHLAEIFYEQALQGAPIGDAMQQARVEVRETRPADPIWAAFLLYGDPRTPLLTSDRWTRQQATILCARLPDLDSVLSTLSTEATTELLDAWTTLVTSEIARYGGMIHSVMQELVLGTFGLTPGLVHDAERATRAALAIQKRLPRVLQHHTESGDQPAAALGIHTGEALIRPSVSDTHGKLTVAGEAVAHVRWLATQAKPGQVLVSAEAAQPLGSRFAVIRALVEAEASRPATTFQVLGPGESPGYRTPFLGREPEMAMLRAGWERAVQGRGQIVGVVGEAGIGKTRLLQAFRDELEADISSTGSELCRWVEARCPSTRPDAPFGALAALMRAWFRLPPDMDPAKVPNQIEIALQRMNIAETWPDDIPLVDAASILSDVLGVGAGHPGRELIEPQVRHGMLVRISKELIRQSAYRQPLILVLDDAHCVDHASLEIIHRLVDDLERLPMWLILAYRPEWTHGWINRPNYRQITLDRLSDGTAGNLLDALLGTKAAASELGDAILARSGGTPFFLEELVRSLRDEEVIVPANGSWQVIGSTRGTKLPSTIQRTIAGRINRLSPAAKRLLQVAAVTGGSFTPALLAHALGAQESQAALEENLTELIQSNFIFERWPEGEFEFRQPLVQEVAYASLSDVQCRRFHRWIGESLEKTWAEPAGEQVEVLAHHFYQSVARLDSRASAEILPEEIERAAGYLLQVGAHALRCYANHEAMMAYRRAGELLEQLPSPRRALQLDCLEGLGRAYRALGDFDDALGNLEQAFAALRQGPMSPADRRRAADMARRIGRIYGWRAEYSAALRWMEEGLQTLGADDRPEHRAVRALLHAHTGSVHYWQGRHEKAAVCYRRGIDLLERTEHWAEMAECYNGLGAVYDTQGQGEEALKYYEQSLALWQKVGDAYQIARVEDNISTAYFYLGAWDKALEYDRKGLAFWEKIDDRDKIAYSCVNLSYAYLSKGEWESAQRYAERARDLCQGIGNWRNLAHSYINLGWLSKAQDEIEEAHAHFEQAQGIVEDHDVEDLRTEVYRGLAEVELARGDASRARDLAGQALDEAVAHELRTEQGTACRVLGMIQLRCGQAKLAEAHLEQSLAILEETGNQHEVGRTLVALARLCQSAGQPEQAQAYLVRAMEIFEELEALPDLEEATRNELPVCYCESR